jgi:CBS domain-containing protein
MTGVQQPGSGSCDFETAAEHALTRVPVVSPSSSVEEIRGSLAQGAYDSLTHVAVVEGARLVGVLGACPEGATLTS